MQTASAAYLAAVRQGFQLVTRVALLDREDGETEVEELTGEDGHALDFRVSMDRTRLPRRTATLTVANPGGLWSPRSLMSAFWLNRRFLLQHGAMIDGRPEWMSLGRFMVDSPEEQFTIDDATLSVQASDYWKVAYKRKNRQPILLERGMRLEEVVVLLGEAMGYDRSRMAIADSGVTLAGDIPIEAWQDLPEQLSAIVSDHAHEMYHDESGWLTVGPAPRSGATAAPVFGIAPGEDSVLLRVTKGLSDADLYNATMVVAEGAHRPTVTGEARDMNPDSPAYNPPPGYDPAWPLGGGPLGDRLLPVRHTARLSDEYAATQLAEALLFEHALIEKTYGLSISPVAALVPGDVIRVRHDESDTDAEMLIDGIEISSGIESDMELRLKEVRVLSNPYGSVRRSSPLASVVYPIGIELVYADGVLVTVDGYEAVWIAE